MNTAYGKVALVTGASRGLGASMAVALASAGWKVIVNYSSDTAAAGNVVQKIKAAGGDAFLAKFDVTDAEALKKGLDKVTTESGPIDLIVNNATGPQPYLEIENQTWSAYEDQLRFFVKAPLLLLQYCLKDWRLRHGGRVINIGSEVVNMGTPIFAHYVAAKAAMMGLTRSWANELGPDGITVNLVEPGWIPVERHKIPDERRPIEDYRRLVPLDKIGTPADLDGMIVFLASTSANFITGQTFAVNGGRTLA